MRILALDPATESGWAFIDESNPTSSLRFGSFSIPNQKNTLKWKWYRDRISLLVKIFRPELIVAEMPVIAHVGATIHHAKLVGLIELVCQESSIQFKQVAPTEIKKKFTGVGNADKQKMLSASRLIGYDGDNHNVADALLILYFQITD